MTSDRPSRAGCFLLAVTLACVSCSDPHGAADGGPDTAPADGVESDLDPEPSPDAPDDDGEDGPDAPFDPSPENPWDPGPVPIELPECDPTDPMTRVIETAEDWDAVDDPGVRIVCVTPGDWRSTTADGVITIETSGTPSAPRWLVHDTAADPALPHPALRDEEEQAVIGGLVLAGASHWIVAGLTVRGGTTGVVMASREDGTGPPVPATSNVIEGLLVEDVAGHLVTVGRGCDDNAIQHAVLRRTVASPGEVRAGVAIDASGASGAAEVARTRVVRCEIADTTVGVWLADHPPPLMDEDPSYPGTVVSDNDIYLTPSSRTDGEGTHDPSGSRVAAEVGIGIDAASGGDAPVEWVHVLRNRLWGMRFGDASGGGTGGAGEAIRLRWSDLRSTGAPTGRIWIRGNVIWDCVSGVAVRGLERVSVVENVIWDLDKKGAWTHEPAMGVYIGPGGHEVYLNTFVEMAGLLDTNPSDVNYVGWLRSWRWDDPATYAWDVRCNTVIACNSLTTDLSHETDPVSADWNFYYGAARLALPGDHDLVMPHPEDSGSGDLCIEYLPITGPETVCIPRAQPVAASPHVGLCDPAIGSVPGLGVSNDWI